MKDQPDAVSEIACSPPAHGVRALALVLAAACALMPPMTARAQMFIRVAPPSVQQQDQSVQQQAQSALTAMPNNPSAGAATAAPGTQSEAVLSDNGQPVKILDANGKEVKKSSSLWANWRPTFYADLRLTYDDNIFIQPRKSGDFVTSFSPGIVLGWGDYRSALPRLGNFAHEYDIPVDELTPKRYLYIDYHPTVEIFASHTGENTVEEYLAAAGSYEFSKLTLQGQAGYQTLSDTDIDAGDRVDRTLYSASLLGIYTIDDTTSLESGLTENSAEFSHQYESSSEVADRTYLDYQYAPKTNLSVGAGLGYLVPQRTADQLYEQFLGRVRWSASDKLFVSGTVGIEFRQGTAGIDKLNAVFDGAVNYLPFDGTQLSLITSRATAPSDAELGQDVVLTSVAVQGQQRFLTRLFIGCSAQYENLSYQRVSSGLGLARNDNVYNIELTLGLDFTKYAGIQLAGTFAQDDSTLKATTFDDQQVSLRMNVLY